MAPEQVRSESRVVTGSIQYRADDKREGVIVDQMRFDDGLGTYSVSVATDSLWISRYLIYSRIRAATGQDDRAWKRRTLVLIESNLRQVTESTLQALFQAAAYREAITAAVAACARRTGFRR